MSLPQTTAHYRITAKLGQGGMSEVYRATETKLWREVAINALPEAFAQDADRMTRFTREAQVLASLNHPKCRGDLRCGRACAGDRISTSVGAVRGNSSKRSKPSRTRPASGHCSAEASVSSLQYSVRADRGRKGCGANGERQRRRKSPAITRSCSGSGKCAQRRSRATTTSIEGTNERHKE